MQATHKKQASILTATDYHILDYIRIYHFVTRGQITRLHYSAGSETTCQDRLKRLADLGYLNRRKLPSIGSGNTDYFYYLSTQAQKELQAIGVTGFSRVRKQDVDNMKLIHLTHLRSLNDFLISAFLLQRLVPEIRIERWLHDFDLKKAGAIKVSYDCRVHGSRIKEQTTIIPDAWLSFTYNKEGMKERRRCLVIELDTGSTDQTRIRRKFRAYCEYAVSEQYVTLFNTNLITVVYVALTDTRASQLRSWCEQELTLQHLEEENKLFRFGVLPASLDSKEIFLQPSFSQPFAPTPVSLLWSV